MPNCSDREPRSVFVLCQRWISVVAEKEDVGVQDEFMSMEDDRPYAEDAHKNICGATKALRSPPRLKHKSVRHAASKLIKVAITSSAQHSTAHIGIPSDHFVVSQGLSETAFRRLDARTQEDIRRDERLTRMIYDWLEIAYTPESKV